jgi:hypothetical protein
LQRTGDADRGAKGAGRLQLMDMLSHDLTNHQQAALGFLELLDRSESLGDADRRLISRTVESLGHSARLLLQVRALLAKAEQASVRPSAVNLDLVAESARRAVEGVFFTHRICFETEGLAAVPRVRADALLTEALTQLLVLLAEGAPPDRDCLMRMAASSSGERVLLSLTSEGFALDPRVTDALTQERAMVGRCRESESVSLVRELLDHYGALARLEPVPNAVGSQLVIDMPAWGGP